MTDRDPSPEQRDPRLETGWRVLSGFAKASIVGAALVVLLIVVLIVVG